MEPKYIVIIILACIVIGLAINSLRRLWNRTEPEADDVLIKLHREELDITKRKINTGHVSVRKETIHELKNITVPVAREELVVENSDPSGEREKETIRIPYKEDRVYVEKVPVQLEDISVYKDTVTELQHIDENLKEERIKASVSGKATVINNHR